MTKETNISGDLVQGDKVGGDKIAGDKIVQQVTPPDFPLDNLPPPNPNFTGREKWLQTIQSKFQNPHSAIAITQAIAGLGGVGKTQLALAYAHAHRDAYDLIWQLRADKAAALDGDLRRLGTVLRLPLHNADAPTARQMVLSWLNGTEKRWLLLYDNADQMTARELRGYLPGGGGHLLITSRRPNWRGAKTLRLDVFTPDEAADFWPKRLELELEEEAALAELAGELGYLPLALEQAAAYMTTRQKSAADYLRLFREQRQALWDAKRTRPPDDYHATITTTWEMAFEYARQTPGAADLLNLCCFLAPDDIPLAVFAATAGALPEELAAVLGDELALDDALDALQAYSLVTRTGEMLAMHRLVQTVARDQMGEAREKKWVEAATELIIANLADWTRLHEWESGSLILSHMIATANLGLEMGWETERLGFLCNWIGYYLKFLADYAAAWPYYERARAILEAKLGPDHPTTETVRRNLQSLS